MKKTFVSLLLIIMMISTVLTSCDIDKIFGRIDEETEIPLEAPTNLRVDESNATLYWNSVEYAIGYTVKIDVSTYTANTNSFSLQGLPSGEYTISVKANGDGIRYVSSEYSDTIQYTRKADSGNKYEDNVIAAFREFDEINTKNSYLGYGIDIVNANAINSKNVLMNYPIFDMDKLLDEQLLKSNEHYNSFQSIEARTIEEFTQNMSISASVSTGTNVSAKGNIKGVDVSASASLTNGLTSTFTKTSDTVESQHFLEIISENQSYWLILQCSEQRYKELLSDEFKADLYSDMDPALLFQKYGTHMLTSVAMGGSIHMYYTMYSYEKGDKAKFYAEISSQLKSEIEAAYGGYSAGVGNETSFETSFTYDTLSKNYGIQIDECIYAAGGGSYGINSKRTLYDNYYNWQESLDTNPVVIGIKDINSLYPIWHLLDMNVEGAADRYTELYEYFQKYGKGSYDNLLQTFDITPPVDPADITNIDVGEYTNYSENQTVNVTAGQTLKITFDVLPDNANKYQKTFKVNDESLATVDSNTGIVTVNPKAPAGSYVIVTIGAGAVSKQIKLFVINSYTVSFNTRVQGLTIDPIYGVAEGESIYELEPEIERKGFILEGWYKDSANTEKFNFETDYVTDNLTLYANWIAIKPLVTFNQMNGEESTSVNVKYNGTVSKPKDPTKTGYAFAGWYEDAEYTVEYDFSTQLVEDITLYAKWDEILYTVTFETNGGTPVAPYDTCISKDYKIKLPTTVKANYTFVGWYRDSELTDKFNPTDLVTQNITLYAKWDATIITVSFFDYNGEDEVSDESGNIITSQTTNKNVGFKINPVTPYKENHIFKGWYYNGEKIDLETYEFVSNEENLYILIALWVSDSFIIKYTVENDHSFDKNVEVVRGLAVEEYIPEKEGYEFSGWTYYKNGEVYDLKASTPETGDIIEAKGYMSKRSYQIIFDTDGGSVINSITIPYGDSIILPSNPTKEGYTFAGWIGDIPKTMPAHNVTLKAKWNLDTCTIAYALNDTIYGDVEKKGTVGIVSYNVIQLDYARATTYGDYYSFDGWFTAATGGTQITDKNGTLLKNVSGYTNASGRWISKKTEITLYAHWSVVKGHTISFDPNGGSGNCDSRVVMFGSAYGTLPTVTKANHVFIGWFIGDKEITSKTIMTVTSDHKITAKWLRTTSSFECSVDNGYRDKNISDSDNYSETWTTGLNYAELAKYGYTEITVTVTFDIYEKDDGYQEVWTYNKKDGAQLCHAQYESPHKSWNRVTFSFTEDLSNLYCNDGYIYLYFKYGAHGKLGDDWTLGWTVYTISASKPN